MKRRMRLHPASLLLLLAAAAVVQACTPKPYIPVRYRPPEPAPTKAPVRVYFRFVDQRPDPSVLRPAAREMFRYFSGYYSLILAGAGSSEINMGAQSLPALFEIAAGRLLASSGLQRAQSEKRADAVMTFFLRAFHLDVAGGHWTAALQYEAELAAGDGSRATRTAHAAGERKKILGTREAETLLGEVFTAGMNRMALKSLAADAGLVP